MRFLKKPGTLWLHACLPRPRSGPGPVGRDYEMVTTIRNELKIKFADEFSMTPLQKKGQAIIFNSPGLFSLNK
jgi:hypothetical protein